MATRTCTFRPSACGSSLTGSTSSPFAGNPEESIDQWRQRALEVMRWIEEGTLDVLIDRTYPLEDAASAHCNLESQETVGKLLLTP
jgi:NADPH:quinone reductase-like Zn-dependent oxidoreductase